MEIKTKVQIGQIALEFSIQNRQIKFFFKIWKWKIYIDHEWPRKFKCVTCKEEIIDDGQLLRFCEPHRREFLKKWKERLEDERLL